MKLSSIEFCGFRGFKEKFQLSFGGGFTVISGRNGVGKSTIFDAVEFALTGEIDKYRIEKAAKESLQDYVWWRGAGQSARHYVRVEFTSDDGAHFAVTRTREGGADRSSTQIEAALCVAAKPEHALRQLCRTSIIRDELIAALSLDLSETERFDLVRTALGAIEGPGYSGKAKEVVSAAETSAEQASRHHDDGRLQLSAELTQLSQLRDRASRTGDLAAAISTLATELGAQPSDLVERIAAARESVAKGRMRLATLGEAVRETYELVRQTNELESVPYRETRETAVRATEVAKERDNAARKAIEDAEASLAKEQQADAMATALAAIVHNGEHVGLNNGHCPLCGAERTESEFSLGVELAKARAAKLGAGVMAAQQLLEDVRERALEPAQNLLQAQATLDDMLTKENATLAHRAAHADHLSQLRVDPSFLTRPEELERTLEAERDRLMQLERAVLTLESSQAVELVTNTEVRVASTRERVSQTEIVMSRAQAAVACAKAITHAVSRTSAEIVDERLALISPLLNELYSRLRPHGDWRSIEYSIRGDVRRFLSLRVGDGLNPQFIFSSGQRRAAGLAFLLSVHLSRAWSQWKTLLLDDPVQHIDDFRALHLVEVLAALRVDGRQLVCAVEDAELADLLCRRLISTSSEPGMHYDLAYGPTGAIYVANQIEVSPLATSTLRRGEVRAS